MAQYLFTYTDSDAWLETQQTLIKFETVKALDEATAIELFEEQVQGDWDSVEHVEETA